jgi:stalled ribosome rescue protein Dom34
MGLVGGSSKNDYFEHGLNELNISAFELFFFYKNLITMSIEKKLAIWMDHASAHIIEYPGNSSVSRTITSDFTQTEKKESLEKSEHGMHNKEQHQQSDYYRELGKVILQYDYVLLFGPTNAKSELLNFLKSDHKFDQIKIRSEAADKMNTHQELTFVKKYFSQPVNL